MALHAEVKQFVCDECGRAFRQRVALQIHTRSHRCGRLRGASAAELSAMAEAREKRAESLTAADGLGRFKIVCWACAEPFGSQRALRQHATAVHAAKSGLGWEPGLSSLGSFNLPRSGI